MNHFSNRLNRNTIHVGMPTDINLLDNSLTKYEGIHLQNTTGFEVSENHIFGYISSEGKLTDENLPYSVGITTASTLSANEEIYKNDLHDLNWPNVANGNNNSTSTNGGLRYVCNTNFGNNYDFIVADFPGTSGAQIGDMQTDFANPGNATEPERAAGNTFTQGNTNANNDFWNETQTGGITYRYFLNGSQIPSSYNSDMFFPENFIVPNGCAPEITLFNDPSGNTSNSIVANWQTHKLQSRNEWLATRYLWKSLIDGGSTEELQSEIENAYTGTTWVERQKLLDFGPFLTHTVLTEVADNTTVFPHPVALEIFMANPDVLNDKVLLDHLSQKVNPMPEYMIDILRNSSNQITSRTILEDELRTKQSTYLDAAQKIFRARLGDGTFTIEEQLEELKQWKNLPTEYQIIEYYMEIGDHETALERYSLIPEICDLNREGNRDYELFYEWLNLRRAIYDDDQYMDSLPSAFVEQLQLLADSYPYSYAGVKAMLVMNEYYGGEYEQEPFVPLDAPTPKSLRKKVTDVEMQLMQVYPDPAKDMTTIQMALPSEIFEPGKIRISDLTGKQIIELSVLHFNQIFTLNLSDRDSGVYNVSLYTGGKLICNKKLNVVR